MRYVIGIDPGKNGAIVVLHCESETKNIKKIETFVMPTLGNQIDIKELNKILCNYLNEPCHVSMEDVHAIFGSSAGATFSFGYGCGVLEGVISTLDLPYTLIQPKVWQKEMFQGISEIRKPNQSNGRKGGLETKKMALMAVKRLFPSIDTRATVRCKNSHDGIIDALLIAEYGRRKYS